MGISLDPRKFSEDLAGLKPQKGGFDPSSFASDLEAVAPQQTGPDMRDIFGEPRNEHERELEEEANAVARSKQPGWLSPPVRTTRTAALGLLTGAGRTALSAVALPYHALKAVFAPLTPGEARNPLTQAGATRYGPRAVEEVRRVAATPPDTTGRPSETQAFLQGLNPMPTINAALEGDPRAVGSLLAMPVIGKVGGELTRGTSLVRRGITPETAEAFRTLGLDQRTASATDVQAAWRERIRDVHPDVNPSAEAASLSRRYNAARDVANQALGARVAQAQQTEPTRPATAPRAQPVPTAPPEPAPAAPAPRPPIVTPSPDQALRAEAEQRLAQEATVQAARKSRETVSPMPGQPRGFEVTGERETPPVPTTPTVTEILTGTFNPQAFAQDLEAVKPEAPAAAPPTRAPVTPQIEPLKGSAPLGLRPEPGQAHDQAAIQEGLFGEKTLAGREQTELLPETAGVPTAKLGAEKITAPEVSRVKREGVEPAGERPMELKPEPERIVGAVVGGFKDDYVAPTHIQAMSQLKAAGDRADPSRFGPDSDLDEFKTSTGRIVKREEALQIAQGAEQLEGKPIRAGFGRKGLAAEDIGLAEKQTSPAVRRQRLARKKIEGAVNPKFAKMSNEDLDARYGELMNRVEATGPAIQEGVRPWVRKEEQSRGAGMARKGFGGYTREKGVISGTSVSGAAGRAIGARKTAERIMGEIEQELKARGVEGTDPASIMDRYDKAHPPAEETAEREAIEKEPDFEALAQKAKSELLPKLRSAIVDDLVDLRGMTRENVGKMSDRELINVALEEHLLDPQQESDVLDALFDMGRTGAVRVGAKAPPGVPPISPKRNVPDAVRRMLSPASRTPQAATTAEIVRARAAELARENERARATLGQYRKTIKKLPTADRLEFIDRIETGQKQKSAELQPVADAIRAVLDDARKRVQDLGTGRLEHFIEDYFPHIWEDPAKARDVVAQVMGKRPLQGPKSFLKQRTIPTIAEGIDAGLKPVTDDPLDLTLLKLREMNRYVMGQRIIQDLKDRGLTKFVRSGQRPPPGYAAVNDSIASVFAPRTAQGALAIRGAYYLPEPAALILNNYLSGGLRGNPIFDAYMGIGNVLNQVQLGLSLFHLGFVSMDAGTSRLALGIEQIASGKVVRGLATGATSVTAPFSTYMTGSKVIQEYMKPGSVGGDMAKVVDALTAGGGRVRMDQFYKNNAVAAFLKAAREGNTIGTIARALPAALELAAKPLMEHFVPRMKLGVFADLARFELDKLPPTATVDDLRAAMAKVWDSVDNRMGQMVYDNLFWNRTLKDASMASVRALGWNLGTIRELGGGVADVARGRFSHRAAYVIALPIFVALLGAVISYLYGNKPEKLKDYFYPRTGRRDADGNDERVQLPTYMRDVTAYTQHPMRTVEHKLHPLLAYLADMWENEDFYGDQIRNPNDPLVKQLEQAAKFTAKQFTPIGVSNLQEQRRRLQSPTSQLLPFIGVTPAPREVVRTKAQNLMYEFLRRRRPSGATPEEAELRTERTQILRHMRQGEPMAPEERADLLEGGATRRQVRSMRQQARVNPMLSAFKQLTAEEAQQVYDLGTPEEQRIWVRALQTKRRNRNR